MQPLHTRRFPWNLDWNLLRTFMVIVEQRGISKSAVFLGLKQPTVSAALKRLEETVGKQLIVRKPNEFTVTRAGHALYTECATIFGAVSQLPAILEEEVAELRGHISIAITSSVDCQHFDDVLSRFSQAHPSVTYSFSVFESEDVENMVSLNRASLGICLLSSLPKHLDHAILYKEYFGLYCGPRHHLFHAEKVSLGDLEGEPFVAFQTEDVGGPLEEISKLRARLKLSRQWRGVSSSLNEIRRMIMTNIGLGALPVHVARQDVEAGNLRQLPPYTDLPEVSIYLLSNPARRHTDAERALLTAINKELDATGIEERTYKTL
ncbi:LysR family transcriptional regulator [Marivita geojedonensis]|uniref:LysR family transcriptional regulator n=1 Tax=Marivita geojedonensis TaxID=1123756 RepID=A0A1X4NLB2_9RHOB|nr:LysR family transcriptional regulator [Marivita geojedonensis]OSQ51066.1 LysR family transcriptional regulator [Marivita geojedonensis]PRY79924.1 DNA-binding transcriptional LysR family regulator [Marivita geojedonensis]